MGFVASACLSAVTLVLAIAPTFNLPWVNARETPSFPAAPGYVLPWAGGEIHAVTQGEETPFTHNGLAAYAFDFDLNYDTVVASRGGRVALVYAGSNVGGCDPIFSTATNYVVIDHGDGTSAAYLHLANASALVKSGDIVDQGQPIAVSGDTGVTCADVGDGAAPHLHFQVQETKEGHYFTQSLPITFDDVSSNEGIPAEGESYASGNYGKGRPQKIKLVARRAQREFAPKAVAANPALIEASPLPVPRDDAGAPAAAWPQLQDPEAAPPPGDAPAASATDTRTPKPTKTPTPPSTDTPVRPPSTDTPAPADTPVPPAATSTPPPPVLTETPVGEATTAAASPPPPTETSSPTAVAPTPAP